MTRLSALLQASIVAGASLLATDVPTRPLAELPRERVEVRAWMKRHGWKSKRHDPGRFELEGRRLHLVSEDDSVLIGTKRGFPIDPAVWPRLRFRLRVDQVPTGTELAEKSGDDAAFRLYVAFDEGGGLFSPPNTIAYTWTADLAPGTLLRSAHFPRQANLPKQHRPGVDRSRPETRHHRCRQPQIGNGFSHRQPAGDVDEYIFSR